MSLEIIKQALAASPDPKFQLPTNPVPRMNSLGEMLGFALNIIFYTGIALSTIFLIIAGIRFVTSGGDKAGTEGARKSFTNAVIGFILVIGVFAVRIIIQNLLGVTPGTVPGNLLPTF